VRQNVNRHDCVVRNEGGLLQIKERGPLRCMAARIVFTFSVFGNCNSMCKYGVSTYNDPAYIPAFVDACVRACVRTLALRAYRPHGLHRSAQTDSRLCLSLSLLHYARNLSHFNVQLRYAAIELSEIGLYEPLAGD